jgi:hypothetical protein
VGLWYGHALAGPTAIASGSGDMFLRLVIAFVVLFLVGCGNAPVSSTSAGSPAPSAAPSASFDAYKAACSAARDDISAISDLVGAMLTSMTKSDSTGASTYRDDARAAATTAVRRLPEGYGTVTPLFDYSADLRDLLDTLSPQPDMTAVRNATVKLVAAKGSLATCTGS